VIVTRTPFRVTLGGGGTDLPSYYSQHGGFIFAMGLDKYMYVMVNRPVVGRVIRLHYSQAEVVNHVSELRHELAREALRRPTALSSAESAATDAQHAQLAALRAIEAKLDEIATLLRK